MNGAIPGYMSPTSGQAFWALGFAKSMANHWSIFAYDIGLPQRASIAFGLPAVLTMAALLRMGVQNADAYSAAFAIWLVIAFWGAYAFARQFSVGRIFAVVGATLWATSPVIWTHNSYSMTLLGFALLPAYMTASVRLVKGGVSWFGVAGMLIATTVSAFMDGYSFMCFAAGTCLFGLHSTIKECRHFMPWWRLTVIAATFALAAGLYIAYTGGAPERYPIEFFRAYGANIEFFVVPTKGVFWFFDLIGASNPRSLSDYFGDGSVYISSFILPFILIAFWAIIFGKGSRDAKMVFCAMAIVGIYFALGPSFKLFVTKPPELGPMMPAKFAPIPTGTGLLDQYLPGFSTMRASYRWVLLAVFGLWAVFIASKGHRKSFEGGAIWLAILGVILHIPNSSVFTAYRNYRQQIVDADRYVRSVGTSFDQGEKVLFLPWDNDFFATFLAPNVGIRTFNIGGDKNLNIARANWPHSFLAIKRAKIATKDQIEAIFKSGAADAVALSYISNFTPVFGWPVAQTFKSDADRLAGEIADDPAYQVTKTGSLAVIRLAHLKEKPHPQN